MISAYEEGVEAFHEGLDIEEANPYVYDSEEYYQFREGFSYAEHYEYD